MNRLARTLLLSLALVGVAACSSKPIQNIEQAAPASSVHSDAEMQKAIVSALNQRGWQVQRIDSDQVLAKITVRGRHQAEITIPYSATQFGIQYRHSRGLDYNNGKIHRNYNKWVILLRDNILQNLQGNSLSLN